MFGIDGTVVAYLLRIGYLDDFVLMVELLCDIKRRMNLVPGASGLLKLVLELFSERGMSS